MDGLILSRHHQVVELQCRSPRGSRPIKAICTLLQTEVHHAKIEFHHAEMEFHHGVIEFHDGQIEFRYAEIEFYQGQIEFHHAEIESDHGWIEFHDGQIEFHHAEIEFRHDQIEFDHDQIEFHHGEIEFRHGQSEFRHGRSKFRNDVPKKWLERRNSLSDKELSRIAVSLPDAGLGSAREQTKLRESSGILRHKMGRSRIHQSNEGKGAMNPRGIVIADSWTQSLNVGFGCPVY